MRKGSRCSLRFELQGWRACHERIAGVDEVGRGSLFGPVVAAAVILDPARRIRGIQDSKQLSPEQREILAIKIRRTALAWAIGSADAGEIDRINIYQASRIAMQKAVLELNLLPDLLLIDALRLDLAIPQISIVHGDALSVSIAAASILAKVERDSWIRKWDELYPQYQLAQNKGYSTPDHLAGLEKYGPTPQHRYSYEPVAAVALGLRSRRQASPFAKPLAEPQNR
ncbi:MAG: ribonuclease HII [Acidobacteria bacterium]|nr:ribonuclease HII [Acidobacteriota bacterium]